MGFLKQMKDMKAMVAAAPDLIDQSNQLSANARTVAEAQQAAALASLPPAPTAVAVADADLAPIAGVSLELYAEISRSFAEVGYDQARGPELAGRKGVAPDAWALAVDGWNARIAAVPTVAARFNALYTGR